MFLHDWDNPINIEQYPSIDLKGVVKPIQVGSDYIISFTVTEDVMAMVTQYTYGVVYPHFEILHKGQIYKTQNASTHGKDLSTLYTIYPNKM